MARFTYKALAASGEVLTGEIDAETREAAIARLRGRQIVPLTVDSRRSGRGVPVRGNLLARRKPNDRDLMLFTRELAIFLAADIPLASALSKLDGLIRTGPAAGLAGRVLRSVRDGSSLADALRMQGDVFPAFYVGMVRAGEAGGSLVEVLRRLSDMLEKAAALRAKLRSALTYPILVLLLTGFSLVVLLVYVVPEFRPMFAEAGADLPLSTRIVITMSDLVTEWGWIGAVLIGIALVTVRGQRLSPAVRARIDAAKLRIPLAGDLIRKIETARFCRSLGTLRANDVVLPEAVRIASGTLSNRIVARAASSSVGPLERGDGLVRPLRESGQFPELALELIAVGEESGKMHEMLLQIADIYDAEVERSIERLLALLSPVVTIGLGGLIAFIIGAILSAILGSYDIAL